MKIAHLPDRALVSISGEDAEKFLENIVTCTIADMTEGTMNFGALLTPQGKILFDFFVLKMGDTYQVDIAEALRSDFIKRLGFYKLRAKVEIEPVDDLKVYTVWDGDVDQGIADPRHSRLGLRLYATQPPAREEGDYHSHRIAIGMPEGGCDFEYGDAYPHEVLMDQFGGVDFKKGCYVGQEVVSRMQHRGTAKKRVIHVAAAEDLPETGTPITADGRPAGRLGTVRGNNGLALLRLDRAAKSVALNAGDVQIGAKVQDWVSFSMPEPVGDA